MAPNWILRELLDTMLRMRPDVELVMSVVGGERRSIAAATARAIGSGLIDVTHRVGRGQLPVTPLITPDHVGSPL